MKRCSRCVLPELWPFIRFNKDGVCNICLKFEKNKQKRREVNYVDLEGKLKNKLDLHKGKGKYDCLVMCSGGKDSIYLLYLLVKKYKLNVLAFTFDNGFETKEALKNIRNSIKKLNVEWVYFKSKFMKEFFAYILKSRTKSILCFYCYPCIIVKAFEVAKQNNITLIVNGFTKGQINIKRKFEILPMTLHHRWFILTRIWNHPKFGKIYKILTNLDKYLSKNFSNIELLFPYQYIKYDPRKAIKILKNKLKWKMPTPSYPCYSTNCLLNFLQVYLSRKNFGFSYFDQEMSDLIRIGEITREYALNALEMDIDPNIINSILKKLNLSIKDI